MGLGEVSMEALVGGAMKIQDVSIRAALAVGFAGAAVFCWVTETPMHSYQEYVTTTVLTYYFAARTLEERRPF